MWFSQVNQADQNENDDVSEAWKEYLLIYCLTLEHIKIATDNFISFKKSQDKH